MWTRSAASRFRSLHTLRHRNVVTVRELESSSRRNWQGYQSCFHPSAQSPKALNQRNYVLGCLRYQAEEDEQHQNQVKRKDARLLCWKERYGSPEVRRSIATYSLPIHQHRSLRMEPSSYLQQQRPFSTKGDKSPSKGDTSSGDNNKTEPDFANYLAGATDSGKGRNKAESAASSTPPTETHIDLEGTKVPLLDDHTEKYRYIRRRQRTSWDRAREKTTENVQRALAGNVVICAAKLAASISSGSSSMFSEFIHSVVDCGNQSLLLLGLRDAGNVADRKHPYGYGKSIYFWALVSALGTFFLGAGISGTQAWAELMEPSLSVISWQVWSVLGFSFAVDGYVLSKTVVGIRESMPTDVKVPFWSYVSKMRDPATMAVLLEDGAACAGIVIAIAGIAATSTTGMPIFDGLAGLAISGLLASMGLVLVRINHRFLLGQAVDPEITNGIEKILLSQRSIDGVHSVQSQWTGPHSFSFKAEVDFDGTYLAATLMPRYQQEFLQVRDTLDRELRVLLSWYAEDVMRTVEREVRHVESEIRKEFPGAEFIELEPMSKDFDRFAIDDGMEAQLRRIEIESLNRYLRSLYKPIEPKSDKAESRGEKPDDVNTPTAK